MSSEELAPGTKLPGRETDHAHPEPMLRMTGTTPPVQHTRRHAQGFYHHVPFTVSLILHAYSERRDILTRGKYDYKTLRSSCSDNPSCGLRGYDNV